MGMSGNKAVCEPVCAAAQMALEGLEARQLMSVSLEGGVLELAGTGRADQVTLRALANRYVLNVNGERSVYSRDAVRSIRLEGNKGHDNITILSKVWNATEVKIQGGCGRDQITRAVDDGFPAPPLLSNAVYARDYGAVGDGVTDDAPAIQAAINAAAPGSTIVLEAGRTYYLKKGLAIRKPLALEGQGAALLLEPNSSPENNHVWIESQYGAESYEWLGSVTQGQTEFMVAAPGLKVGDTVHLGLGHDPYDHNEQHFAGLAKVVYSDGLMVKLDTPAPRDINQGTRTHRITRVETVAENITVRNLRFDWVGGVIIDAAVWVQSARNVTVEHLRGRFTGTVAVVDSTGVVIRDVKGELIKNHPAAGRVLTAWQSDVEVYDVKVSTSADTPVIFTESWNRRLRVHGLEVDWGYRGSEPQGGVVHLTGGSSDAFIDDLVVHNDAPVRLVTTGGAASEFRFGRVEIDGNAIALPLSVVEHLKLDGVDYGAALTLTRQVELSSDLKGWGFPLIDGYVKEITVELSSQQGVQGVYVINSKHQGVDVVPYLVNGRAQHANLHYFGLAQVFNVADAQQKSVHVYTGADLLPGTMLTVNVEYYPA